MIVVDIETSGLYPEKHGIWQIGALDFYNPYNIFFDDAHIDDEDEIEEGAIKVHGRNESWLRRKEKQTQKSLLKEFFAFIERRKIKNFICQNPQFDIGFIKYKARKYALPLPYHNRAFDLHSIAQAKYFSLHREFLLKDDHSNMGLTNILNLCGIPDKRNEHNALEDAKLTAECFSRLVYGRSLIPEYARYPIPKELRT